MPDNGIELFATCWTSAGDVAPLMASEVSPVPVDDRIAAVASTGWAGMGFVQDDLKLLREQIGFDALRTKIADAGLKYTEVEILGDWWETGPRREASDAMRELLFDAAVALDAAHIKIGTAFGDSLDSIDPLVAPLRDLADAAADRGVRVAIEAMPFSMVSTIPMAADLVHAVDRPNCGVLVDSWHVFRAGTPLADLRESLSREIIFGVELDDAAAEVSGTMFEDTRDRRLPCGEGAFDLVGLIQTLHGLGWTGPWGVELISNEHRAKDVVTALRDAHDSALAVISEALS
ncbi:sugar phosphate isomerase/epimerase family protein [Gordonia caeni]|uniref:Sugar phosphate isomerase/epimerase n=1 Tax=Gordonia caeni TaxID=1007097 RepID=A0ABP7NM72_9ACTN